MNGYRITIRNPVYVNGKFWHNVTKSVIIHAKDEDEAKGKVELEEGTSRQEPNGTTISRGGEYIAYMELLGRVEYRKVPYYVKDSH